MGTRKRGDGTGSVYRRSDGKWVAQIRSFDEFDGKSRKWRRYATTRDGARELLKQMQQSTPPQTRRTDLTLAQYFRLWVVESLPRTELTPSTKEIYRGCLEAYGIPAAGRIGLAGLTPREAEGWLARVVATKKRGTRDPKSNKIERNGNPIAASTARNTYNAAIRALDTAVRDGLLPVNPLRDVERPKSPRPPVPVTRADDVERIREVVAGWRIETLFVFVAFTGCRIGEATSLRWSDVDLESGTATIRRGTLDSPTTKTGKARTLTLIPEVVKHLQSWRVRQKKERLLLGPSWQDTRGLVFTTSVGTPLERHNVSRDLKRALRAAGVDAARPWHSLRHGLAHRLLAKGIPLQTASAILGHSGIQITADTYGHVDAAVPVEILSDALGSKG